MYAQSKRDRSLPATLIYVNICKCVCHMLSSIGGGKSWIQIIVGYKPYIRARNWIPVPNC